MNDQQDGHHVIKETKNLIQYIENVSTIASLFIYWMRLLYK